MEPSVLLLVLVTAFPTGIFAWSFGAWRNARATAMLAVAGLAFTALGVGFALLLLYAPHQQGAQAHNSGIFTLLALIPAGATAWFGTSLTLAVCLIGLRQAADQHIAWLAALLVGALAPVAGLLALLLFSPGLYALTRGDTNLQSLVFNATQTALFLAPAVAGTVTTAYALWAARLSSNAVHLAE